MFKNYLTYQFAQSFDRACRNSEISIALKTEVLRSSEKMLLHFKEGLESSDRTTASKKLFVALLCLRDCKESLDRAGLSVREVNVPYQVLAKRLEQLCVEVIPPVETTSHKIKIAL